MYVTGVLTSIETRDLHHCWTWASNWASSTFSSSSIVHPTVVQATWKEPPSRAYWYSQQQLAHPSVSWGLSASAFSDLWQCSNTWSGVHQEFIRDTYTWPAVLCATHKAHRTWGLGTRLAVRTHLEHGAQCLWLVVSPEFIRQISGWGCGDEVASCLWKGFLHALGHSQWSVTKLLPQVDAWELRIKVAHETGIHGESW